MNLLAIDTSASLCAACVLDTATGEERGRAVRDIGKGHAEHLMAVIDEALLAAGIGPSVLSAIAVSVGPGSFTGIRVGVAAARGLALALGRRSVGVSTLEAIAAEAAGTAEGPVLAALDAGRGQVYAQIFGADGLALAEPAVMDWDKAARLTFPRGLVVAGTGAARLVEEAGHGRAVLCGAATADTATYARLGMARLAAGAPARPTPLYLRSADAKPQQGFAIARQDPG